MPWTMPEMGTGEIAVGEKVEDGLKVFKTVLLCSDYAPVNLTMDMS